MLLVDAAQSTGVVPIDVAAEGVDALVTTAMKWLLGPPGVGFLYLSPELLRDAPVLDVGYIGLDAPLGDWPVRDMPGIVADGRRYELGLPNLPGMFAARAGHRAPARGRHRATSSPTSRASSRAASTASSSAARTS